MGSNDKFKNIYIKNCMCYYFNDMMKVEYSGFDNILLDEKSYKNILIYGISYKTLTGPQPFYIRFNKVDGLREFILGLDIW